MLQLREHQKVVVDKLLEGFKSHRSQILYAPTGCGKCLGKGTPVLMFDGTIKTVENVVAGDLLMGPDSLPRTVLSTVKGIGELYKVTPTKGDSYIVNDAHILSLKITGGATRWDCSRSDKYKTGKIYNINVLDYLKESKTFKHCAKGWRTGVLFEEKYQPINPYYLGLWLGDGISKTTAICTEDQEILEEIYKEAEFRKLSVKIDLQKNNNSVVAYITSGRKNNNSLLKDFQSLNLISNKHIPHSYLTGSEFQRLELLAGLIDTDGSLSRNCFDFVQKNKRLAHEVVYLARSLGLAAYIVECQKKCHNNGKVGIYWRVSISGNTDKIPCRIPRKKATTRLIKKDALSVGITVNSIGTGEYFGFEIDKDKLFLLGDFTVTHNTEMAIAIMAEYAKQHRKVSMILDRIVLVEQTSLRLGKYNIPHGVLQAGHWRHRPQEHIQICSAQTLESRSITPDMELLIYDECHVKRKGIIDIIEKNPHLKVIGLTATPFTKGLGKIYSNVVNAPTTQELIEDRWLTPLKVFIAKEIDMTGAKKVAGEWSEADITDRGMKITGDIVAEWHKKTYEIYGKPVKTVVFCAGVDHGRDLEKNFKQSGHNFVSISYKEDSEYKRQVIEEFSKPDSEIIGLIATDILTKGFDVSDVMIGISARPFSKSLSSHVQQMGRVMRTHEGKEFATWLDHSGNYLRFRKDWDDLYEYGVKELNEGKESTRAEPTEREKKESKCPACAGLWTSKTNTCDECGFEKKINNHIVSVAGELKELDGKIKQKNINQEKFYAELLYYGRERGYKDGWSAHKFKEKVGVFPPKAWGVVQAIPPSFETANWIRSRAIAYAKGKAKWNSSTSPSNTDLLLTD